MRECAIVSRRLEPHEHFVQNQSSSSSSSVGPHADACSYHGAHTTQQEGHDQLFLDVPQKTNTNRVKIKRCLSAVTSPNQLGLIQEVKLAWSSVAFLLERKMFLVKKRGGTRPFNLFNLSLWGRNL